MESGFTSILRRFWGCHDGVLAALFVDHDGECVDYCSELEPFDAKVAGAQMNVTMAQLVEPLKNLAVGVGISLFVSGTHRELLVRRVNDTYTLVAVLAPGAVSDAVTYVFEDTARALRIEGMLDAANWDPIEGGVEVQTRPAAGWGYAPVAIHRAGRERGIESVLGAWQEDGGAAGGTLMCFRVVDSSGDELTLAHDVTRKSWLQW
ncbi:MAG: hypothetical protein AAF550_01250 [Myxococcota bacterium]